MHLRFVKIARKYNSQKEASGLNDKQKQSKSTQACLVREGVDLSKVEVVRLHPKPWLEDYRAAMTLANSEAKQRLGDCMLLSWYDKYRDFESPQHSSECHADSCNLRLARSYDGALPWLFTVSCKTARPFSSLWPKTLRKCRSLCGNGISIPLLVNSVSISHR